MSSFIISINFM